MLIFSSRVYLLIWETGRRSVVMNGAKVLGHVISERRPAGSESEARHVLGIAAFFTGLGAIGRHLLVFPALALANDAAALRTPYAL